MKKILIPIIITPILVLIGSPAGQSDPPAVYLPLVAQSRTTPAPPPLPTATIRPTLAPPSPVEQVVAEVNRRRAEYDKPALEIDERLNAAAQRHSDDMATNDFVSHMGSDGSSPWDRIREAGYPMWGGGETIGAGYTTAAAVVEGWMNSPPHRDILLGDYVHVGVGYAYDEDASWQHYWTVDASSPAPDAEIVLPTLPAPSQYDLATLVNGWRIERNLRKLERNEELKRAARWLVGDGTHCPWDEVPPEILVAEALYYVGYEDAAGYSVLLCGMFPRAESVLEWVEERGGPRRRGLIDIGYAHTNAGFERDNGKWVADIWALIIAEPRVGEQAIPRRGIYRE